MVGLGATYEIWHLSGKPRQVAAADFQIELISIDFFVEPTTLAIPSLLSKFVSQTYLNFFSSHTQK